VSAEGYLCICCVWHSFLVRCVLFVVSPPARPAYAGTITVNTTQDQTGAGPECSLREAIQSANTADFGGCTGATAGQDVIQFSVNGTFTVGGTSTIVDDLRIVGNGTASTIINGGNTVQPFVVNSGVTAEFEALTIRNGLTAADGGALLNDGGDVTFTNSVVSLSTAGVSGGGIRNQNGGSLTIVGTTRFGHTAAWVRAMPFDSKAASST
jgi:CSLREA domain-containing protein